MILTHEVEEEPDLLASRERYWAAWRTYGRELSKADVLVTLNGLQPLAGGGSPTSPRDGQRSVHVAAASDPVGLRGRYFILDVADIQEAVAWARRCPAAANGDVEVRPVLQR
jgi:hypothetical protein